LVLRSCRLRVFRRINTAEDTALGGFCAGYAKKAGAESGTAIFGKMWKSKKA
jgi:hypothetical protein